MLFADPFEVGRDSYAAVICGESSSSVLVKVEKEEEEECEIVMTSVMEPSVEKSFSSKSSDCDDLDKGAEEC